MTVPYIASYHAAQRVRERHGVQPDEALWRGVLLDITDTVAGLRHAALLLRREGHGTEIWAVRIDGVARKVVYNPATAEIVTVYP